MSEIDKDIHDRYTCTPLKEDRYDVWCDELSTGTLTPAFDERDSIEQKNPSNPPFLSHSHFGKKNPQIALNVSYINGQMQQIPHFSNPNKTQINWDVFS